MEPTQSQNATYRVLLAEDNIVNQQVSKKMLEKLKCYVDVVANGKEAVAMSQKLPYDIIFMDCQMPEMDGYEATREIRKLQKPEQKTPVIAVTANVMAGDREKCLAAGMDDYIGKPVKSEDLKAMLEKWVKKAPSAEASPGSAAGGTEAKSSGPINFERLDYLKEFADDGSGDFIASLFETFFKSADERVKAMKQLIEANDANALGREGHGLKGSSSNLGADPLAALCKELEMMGKAGDVRGAGPLVEKIADELERVRMEYQGKIKKP